MDTESHQKSELDLAPRMQPDKIPSSKRAQVSLGLGLIALICMTLNYFALQAQYSRKVLDSLRLTPEFVRQWPFWLTPIALLSGFAAIFLGAMALRHNKRIARLNHAGIFLGLLGVCGLFVNGGLVDGFTSKVSWVKSDLRELAPALEAYMIDWGLGYPWSCDPDRNAFGKLVKDDPRLAQLPTFMIPNGTSFLSLTTPVVYIKSFPRDPYAPIRGMTYCYYTSAPGSSCFIIWSPGRDGHYDLTLNNIARAYDVEKTIPSPYLIERTYDPTNGSKSGGDIWRVKM